MSNHDDLGMQEPYARPKRHSTLKLLAIALAIAGAGAAAAKFIGSNESSSVAYDQGPSNNAPPQPKWLAAAPGRVEPKSGQVRIASGLPGRIAEVPVKVNDVVEEGELLVRLEDEEARARLAAAEAGAASSKRERDAQSLSSDREQVRKAEDNVFSAERAVTNARFELEYELAAKRSGSGSDQRLADARRNLKRAQDKLQTERLAFATAQSKKDIPAPSRLESALAQSRAEVAVAESLLEKTRVRAPQSGTILQLNAKVGELVTPSPEQALVVIGDMSVVRVKAELDEQDVSKVKIGQKVYVSSNAYPDREFVGRVVELAPSLAVPKITQRGARRATDVEVLEVTIDLDGKVPLLPGMRIDTYFK